MCAQSPPPNPSRLPVRNLTCLINNGGRSQAAGSRQLHQPPQGPAQGSGQAGPAAHMGLREGKAEGMGLNMASNQFPPVWGAMVKLGPRLGLLGGCGAGGDGKGGQQQGILQLQVLLPAMAWVGELLWLLSTTPFLGCPQHPGVLKLECSPCCTPGAVSRA